MTEVADLTSMRSYLPPPEPSEDVHAHSEVIMNECRFIEGRHLRIGHSGTRGLNSFLVMQVVFLNEHTPWIETGGQPSHLVTSIENRLPAW